MSSNIRIELRLSTGRNQTHFEPNPSFFKKLNRNWTKIKNLFCTSLSIRPMCCRGGITWPRAVF